jgi:hypothetical protein
MREGRWFGTPVGAALLVGALAGCLGMLEVCHYTVSSQSSGARGFLGIVFFGVGSQFLRYTLLLSAPAVCLRSGWKLLYGASVAFLCMVVTVIPRFLSYWLLSVQGMGVILYWVYSISTGSLTSVILGYATARFYGYPEVRWRCVLVALAGWLVNMGLWSLLPFADPEGWGGETFQTLRFSFITIASFIQVVPIAYVIERHQARVRMEKAVQNG